jgi:hypothetical protein
MGVKARSGVGKRFRVSAHARKVQSGRIGCEPVKSCLLPSLTGSRTSCSMRRFATRSQRNGAMTCVFVQSALRTCDRASFDVSRSKRLAVARSFRRGGVKTFRDPRDIHRRCRKASRPPMAKPFHGKPDTSYHVVDDRTCPHARTCKQLICRAVVGNPERRGETAGKDSSGAEIGDSPATHRRHSSPGQARKGVSST